MTANQRRKEDHYRLRARFWVGLIVMGLCAGLLDPWFWVNGR